jgi:8-oxo-dGTP pyrophosphatase MutT (NUDIX family)
MTELLYTHAGGIVVRLEDKYPKYLLVRSSTDPSIWIFPKGHIKPGESPEMAALREVREEAGIKAEIISSLCESNFTKEVEKVRVAYFVMRYRASGYAHEDREVKWCSYEEAAATLLFEDARKVLKKAKKILA